MNATTNGLAILAVDDEPRALADIKHLLETSASVDRVATATSAKEALVYLSGGRYDALFLDVHMPEIEGMALARLLRRFADPPAVVFVTGHPDAAVEAFEIQALDFLVKPVSRERLESALGRVEAQSRPAPTPRRPRTARRRRPPRRAAPDVVAVDNPKGGGKRLVRLETISIAQANGDYARIVCDDGRFLLRTPLSQLEKEWSPSGFARVHRAYLVNLDARGRAAGAAQRHRGADHARRDRGPGRAAQRRRAAAAPARLTDGRRGPGAPLTSPPAGAGGPSATR